MIEEPKPTIPLRVPATRPTARMKMNSRACRSSSARTIIAYERGIAGVRIDGPTRDFVKESAR
jgi:hypothetical protein